jgi:antitoxin (DNA-binding transcriptional repressor) of toxin-antitoxin stability system
MKEKIVQTTMAVEDIKVTLLELLDSLTLGDEVILTRNQQPVAKLVSQAPKPAPKAAPKQRPGPGLGKGMITFIAPDFDAPLEDMKEYME